MQNLYLVLVDSTIGLVPCGRWTATRHGDERRSDQGTRDVEIGFWREGCLAWAGDAATRNP